MTQRTSSNISNSFNTDMLRTDSARNGIVGGNMTGNNQRIDNDDLLFFASELTHHDEREFELIKNGLSFLDIFHCNSSIHAGQEAYLWEVYEGYGESKPIAKNAKDMPFVGATGKQFTSKFMNIGVAIEYTMQDLLASEIAKKDMVTRLRKQAMRSNFEYMNKACFHGNAEQEITGLFSDKNLTNKKAVATVRTNKTQWKDKHNEEIFKDLVDAYNDCMEATKNHIPPDTLLVSSPAYNEIATRIFNNFSGITILKQIQVMLNVTVRRVPELNNAFEDNSSGFIYFQNNESYVEQLIPSLFEVTEPHRHYNSFNIGCFSRYGGLVIRQPKMFVMRHGI